MQATPDELETLFAIQEVDLEAARLDKEFANLPQRAAILDARKKREEVAGKLDAICALKKETLKKLTKIEDEDASLQKKESGVQAAIESAGNDFRGIEARTKELDGIFRRRGVLADERTAETSKLTEISALEKKVRAAIDDLGAVEAGQIKSFKEQGSSLQRDMALLAEKRNRLLDDLSDEVAGIYERTSKLFDTVFIGKLDGTRCGVCRSSIETGRLIDLKSKAPLVTCPACKRLLIVDEAS